MQTSSTTSDVAQGDTVSLLIDCDQQIIQLINERSHQQLQLPVDTNKCPFPWQFHVNLHAASTKVQIL